LTCVGLVLSAAQTVLFAEEVPPTQGVEIQVPLVVSEWIDLSVGLEGWWLHRMRLLDEERAPHALEGTQEDQRGYEVEIEHLVELSESWLAELEIDWIDGEGQRIGGSRNLVHLDAEATSEPLHLWLRGSAYGWQRAERLVVRLRGDSEVPRLLGSDDLPPAPHYEEAFAPLDPGLFGVDTWRSLECGFGLPPLCDDCASLGRHCYEVDVSISLAGVQTQPFCSTREQAANDASSTCFRYAIGVGFFCVRPSFRRAQLRHTCDYPHLRYPYTERGD
jgi:hypothetical protein